LVSGLVISDLRFADDISLLADSELDLQSLVDKLSRSSGWSGLEISGSKSEVQVIGRDTLQVVMHMKLGNTDLSEVDEFVSLGLGGKICSDASADRDVALRIGIPAGVARNLSNLWNAKDIS